MCQSIECGPRDITNIAQLEAEIGAENVVIRSGYKYVPVTSCLCPVDIQASAKKAGRVVRKSQWPMEWVMESQP
jgi:hypothetical protein